MERMEDKIRDVMVLQDELSRRTGTEREAAKLIAEGRCQEADKLLAGLEIETPGAATPRDSK
ncbi:MAG: hypothetical protein LUH21_17235 [Clostridiales bacterium]|nr:hypothetical protein [Clostridiales bacterium]